MSILRIAYLDQILCLGVSTHFLKLAYFFIVVTLIFPQCLLQCIPSLIQTFAIIASDQTELQAPGRDDQSRVGSGSKAHAGVCGCTNQSFRLPTSSTYNRVPVAAAELMFDTVDQSDQNHARQNQASEAWRIAAADWIKRLRKVQMAGGRESKLWTQLNLGAHWWEAKVVDAKAHLCRFQKRDEMDLYASVTRRVDLTEARITTESLMSRKCPQRPLIAIIGATGTGKSQLAVSLAKRFNGEIINGDSIQMYDGLPIASNKISIEEQRSIRHHLLGCISLREKPWEVATFRQNAIKVIDEIHARGKLPILVGGTHYYTQALIFKDDIIEESPQGAIPREDWEFKWPILAASTEDMLEELRQVDPIMAARWHPKERRKIKRSLEIYLNTGQRASELYELQKERKSGMVTKKLAATPNQKDGWNEEYYRPEPLRESSLLFDALIFWVHVDPKVLNPRLDERVKDMVSNGLIAEAQVMFECLQELGIEAQDCNESSGIWAAIGYKEFLPYLVACHTTNADTKHLDHLKQEGILRTKNETRQYARRQIKWIRNKLLRALEDGRLDRTLFLLDATDLSQSSRNVEGVAYDITEKFLKGDLLPLPRSISDAAKQILVTKEKDDLYARHCDLCGKTLMSGEQWALHMKGKQHLRLMKPKTDWRALYPRDCKESQAQGIGS